MGCCGSKKERKAITTVNDIKITPGIFVQFNKKKFYEVYELREKLGDGAYSEVYMCIHKATQIHRAVKIFKKDESNELLHRKKFLKEVQIMKDLDHPNITKVYEAFEDVLFCYIVMELSEGGELFDQIIQKQTFNEVEVAKIMRQIISCIAYVHEHGIIHRDVKPENILFEEQDEQFNIKLIDFGSACSWKEGSFTQGIIGSYYYLAPEVFNNKYKKECDVWSCGVIMYLLLCHELPFPGETRQECMEKILSVTYTLEGPIWDGISEEAKDLIRKILCPEAFRISAQEALSDPWILHNGQVPEPPSEALQAALSKMSSFHEDSKLVEAIQSFITSQLLSQNDIKEARSIFRSLNENGSGKLSREELIHGYAKVLGSRPQAEEEVEKVMAKLDSEGTGFVEYSKFIAATVNTLTLMTEDKLLSAFELFDTDHDGKISGNELKKLLADKSNSSQEIWTNIIAEFDESGRAEIDFATFKTILLGKLSQMWAN